MNQIVFTRAAIELIDQQPGFFKKLKDFVGEFRIEEQPIEDIGRTITFSFAYNEIEFIEGEARQVVLVCEKNSDGGWRFESIEKI